MTSRPQPETPEELADRLAECAHFASVFSSYASEDDEPQAASYLSGLNSAFYTSALQLRLILSKEEA